MKIRLSDICSLCCPNNMKAKEMPPEMAERVKSRVMSQIEAEKKPRHRVLKTLLLTAAFAAVLSGMAFALSRYSVRMENIDQEQKDQYVVYDAQGEIIYSREGWYTGEGMNIIVNAVGEEYSSPEFRCRYLPSEPDAGFTDEEGWAEYLCNGGDGEESFPYIIEAYRLEKGENYYRIIGSYEILDERYWDDWYVLTVTSDVSEVEGLYYENDRVNYVLLLNEDTGWFIVIMGTDSPETLEKIAAHLEIREHDRQRWEEHEYTVESVSTLLPARG